MSDPTPTPWTPPQPMQPPAPMTPPTPSGIPAPQGLTPPPTPDAGNPSGVPAGWPAGYQVPGYYGPYQQARPTNGMAIASMIVSIVGLLSLVCYGVPAIIIGPVGAILGHISRKRIRENGDEGAGMALAGIIMGWIGLGLGVLGIALFGALFAWMFANMPDPSSTNYDDPYDFFRALAGML